MSFAAVDGMLEDKSIYPRFSRTNVRTLPTMRAVVGVVKYFGWDAINVVNSGSSSTTCVLCVLPVQGSYQCLFIYTRSSH